MENNNLFKIKRSYLNTKVPHYLENYGWENLEKMLDHSEKPKRSLFYYSLFATGLLVFILFLTSTLVFAAQPSKPGESLYKFKVLSDNIYTRLTGNYESTLDKRADEIIKLKDAPNSQFDEAIDDYQQILEDAKNRNLESQEKEEFKKNLEGQEKKFENVQNNSNNKQNLENIYNQTKRIRGEVKGKKTDKPNEENNEETSNKKTDHRNRD